MTTHTVNITVFGAGHVGLVIAACLALEGHSVCCVDVDRAKLASLEHNGASLAEPGLQECVDTARARGLLRFSSEASVGIRHGDVIFVAVPTASLEDGNADVRAVLEIAREVGRTASGFKVLALKSTVPVGTADRVDVLIREEALAKPASGEERVVVVSNPEFLSEGCAVRDFREPARVLVGVPGGPSAPRVKALLTRLYAPFLKGRTDRLIFLDRSGAEFAKYAANALLASRVSLMNELAGLADRLNVDIEGVRHAVGLDPRIGPSYLKAGAGFGGSCLPKDLAALEGMGREQAVDLQVVAAVRAVNDRQKKLLARMIVKRFGSDLSGCTIAVWGLSFKPGTADMREAPSLVVISEIVSRGGRIRAHDPAAMPAARMALNQFVGRVAATAVTCCETPMAALQGADALVLVTDWPEYALLPAIAIRDALTSPVVFDGRNALDAGELRASGIEYWGVGRSTRVS